jgi:hypothetical protein
MPIARSPPKISRNFRALDFDKFNETLQTCLNRDSPATRISTSAEFHDKVSKLITIIQETIEEFAPLKKPCPFSKRWWNQELTELKKRKSRLSNEAYKYRDIANHPSKEEHKKSNRQYAEAIEWVSKAHWTDWLENISAQHIYTANKYVTGDPTDFSSARIPSLKTYHNNAPFTASTNIDKVTALSSSFFPPPPPDPLIPDDTIYPTPLSGLKFFTRRRIRETAARLKPFKAPGPDGIPNVIIMKSMDTLIDHLFYIFRAALELNVYHEQWLLSSTLVLRKPGKPAYDVAKAYRPIGLLNTIGKLLSTLVAADLSYLAEKHSLLPTNQFGGRPGRSTGDAIYLLTHKIKDAWHVGKVAVALFLDVQGAFPNTVKDRLIHNMKTLRVPSCYIRLTKNMLSNRKTQLIFDDFTSDPTDINNGTTQGCPLSMLFYSFYNAPLIKVAKNKGETSIGFVDDTMFLVVADSLQDAHNMIKDMMERPGGGFEWSTTHNSPFELSKLALMNFPRSISDIAPADLILSRLNPDNSVTTQTVNTVDSYKYLGVVIDPKLRWSTHHQRVIANATWWTLQVSRLSRTSGGMPPKRIRQLYNTVAIPAFTYAADIWFTGIHNSPTGLKRLGSVSVVKKLSSIQRRISKTITGALSTAAGDTLESHANLLPIELLMDKVLFRAASRIASLPFSHPLHSLARKAAKRFVKRHKSPLHLLFYTSSIDPTKVEPISAVRRRPNYTPSFSTTILGSKDEALSAAKTHHRTQVSVYCDGSSLDNGTGGAAVLYINQVEKASLCYHLGPSDKHTVYEGELVGLSLAVHLLTSLRFQLNSYIIIGSDNQAAIKALNNQRPHPGHYI